ncbi:adenylating enzyme cmlK [Candidatus Protofrankia californiensis]|uniref:Adenylating enzyme cmlK n=1 Tax=Candidatus Protofrankia californiensis TaxID=1839754 RepID=A0A1C3NXN4_9ACTN|nr:adenylating enzyme cmlK [Candidatus Protofrankia californiensis]
MRDELIARLDFLGDRTAIIESERSYSYRDMLDETESMLKTLRAHRVRAHEVVVLNSDFSFRSIALLLALYLNRNIVVPVVHLTDAMEATITEAAAPDHIVRLDPDMTIRPLPREEGATRSPIYVPIAEARAAGLILLSSGSTGKPKAILHNLDVIIEEKLQRRARTGTKVPRILIFLLFDHIGGINTVLGAVLGGSPAVVPAERTPDDVCALVERHQVRVLPASPTFLNLILIGGFHLKYDLSCLHLITYGTEPMPDELLRRLNEAFPRVRLLQTFGTSETGISATVSESSGSTLFRISDANVQHRIVDGELHLKSRTQFLGYLNYPNESLTEDGWFRTGDLVEESTDGYLRIIGRAKEVINVGGEKVLPLELESILLSSPLIDDCVVYGVANSITGQAVCVDIKPSRELSRAELRRHVTEFLADRVDQFKIPSKINQVVEIEVSERFKKKRVVR